MLKMLLLLIPMSLFLTLVPAFSKDQKIVVIAKIEQGNLGTGQGGQWSAKRMIGTLTVPANGNAMSFACNQTEFSIYSLNANGDEITHFRRDLKKEWSSRSRQFEVTGTTDSPVPLSSLTLGPGTYYFFVPGKPGTGAKLLLTISTPGDKEDTPDPQKAQYIWVEMENETSARMQSPQSAKETNPTWRNVFPGEGFSGTGGWYLSKGGDVLTYSVRVSKSGSYVFWIRDWTDKKHPFGAQAITVNVDGKPLGRFNEHTGSAGYGWQKLGTLQLSGGAHTVDVIKAETTSSAAILDVMLLTTNPGYVPTGRAASKGI